jgi:hypothetical protein
VRIAGPERAGQASEEALATSFDLREQWPVLFVLSVEDDDVRRVAFVVDHFAADGVAMRILKAQTFPGFMFDGRPFAGFNYMREAVSGENFQQALEAGQIVAWAASGLVGPEPHRLIPSAPAATA